MARALYTLLSSRLIDGPYKGVSIQHIAKELKDFDYADDLIAQGIYRPGGYAENCIQRWKDAYIRDMLLVADPDDYINQNE